ncbi:MAG: 2-oxoacid:ferredoxin oxidoreductase subunit alpha [Conexivisphaerales archaeon]
MEDQLLTWVVGGPQGSGVDSAATIYARAVAAGNLHIYGEREYYSNIKGEHSYYVVMASTRRIRSRLSSIHVLASFEEETVARHALEVLPGGAIVYDPAISDVTLSRMPLLEKNARKSILDRMGSSSTDASVSDILNVARQRGVVLLPLPYQDLMAEAAKQLSVEATKLSRATNVMAVSASLSLLKFPYIHIESAINSVFRGKSSAIQQNVVAGKVAYDFASRYKDEVGFTLIDSKSNEQRLLLQGTQAVALGKIAGGGRFQTYYPITPASDESFFLEEYETLGKDSDPDNYFLVLQVEDEIASVTMAIGAALAGLRASTATSGPGFSLMMEGIGWAAMNEVPLVVTLYQRGGPSTGLPTRSEQADLLFALNAGHGDMPRIVLASGDIEECFYDAVKAYNYAEKYQVPVIHLIDKTIANSTSTVPLFDMSRVRIERGKLFEGQIDHYKRFAFTDDGISPRSFLGQEGGISWYTGDEHDEQGHITEDPEERRRMMEKRMKKLQVAAKDIPVQDKLRYYGPKNPDFLIVGWGATKGAALDAIERLGDEGYSTAFLQVKLMSPFPSEDVSNILSNAKDVIAVESNYSGQLKQLIAQKTGIIIKRSVHKYTGRPIAQDELHDTLVKMFNDPQDSREVLVVGA